MSDKEMVSAKIRTKTRRRLDKYKDDQGISRSQAIDDILKQGLDVQESDMRLVPIKADGGTKLENEVQQTQNQVDEIETVAQEIQSDVVNNRLNYAILGTGLVYIILQAGIGLPDLVSIGIGIPLLISLIWVNVVR